MSFGRQAQRACGPEQTPPQVARDAAVLLPFARDVVAPDGLLAAALDLLETSGDPDVRLAAAQLARHTLPPLISKRPDLPGISELLTERLARAAMVLLSEAGDGAVETEGVVRAFLETAGNWPAGVAARLRNDEGLRAALSERARRRATTLGGLAGQLLELLR